MQMSSISFASAFWMVVCVGEKRQFWVKKRQFWVVIRVVKKGQFRVVIKAGTH